VAVSALMQTKSVINVITYMICMILLHIFCLTENLPGVLDVRFAEKAPAEKRCLLSWEQVWWYFNITEYSQSRSLMWVYFYLVCFSCVFSRKTIVFCRKISEISISQQMASCLPGTPSWKVSTLKHALIE